MNDEQQTPEPETETVEAANPDSETQPEEEQEELVVSIAGEEPEPQAEAPTGAPEWVKELRRKNRELEKRVRQLDRERQTEAPRGETVTAPPKKPTLADVDYDTEAYDKRLDEWYKAKAAHEREAELRRQAEQEAQSQWQAKLNGYTTEKATLKARDFEDAEAVVADTLSVAQQGMILAGAEKPALLIYALGRNPKKAAELAAIKDPVQFAFAVARLEGNLKVQQRKPSAAPEQIVSGNAAKSGAVDNQLDRLRAEADRTGDYSKVMAYKRQLKQRA